MVIGVGVQGLLGIEAYVVIHGVMCVKHKKSRFRVKGYHHNNGKSHGK